MLLLQSPHYFPSVSNFQQLLKVKHVLWADTFPFSRQSGQNRTKIRTPDGFQWLTVPLKSGKWGKKLTEIEISYESNWQHQHWKSIENYYKASPFFDFLDTALLPLFQTPYTHLVDLNLASISLMCHLLGIEIQMEKLSEVAPDVRNYESLKATFPTEQWICTSDYAAPFQKMEISHKIIELPELRYRQVFNGFEPHMSILDVLLMYGEESLSVFS